MDSPSVEKTPPTSPETEAVTKSLARTQLQAEKPRARLQILDTILDQVGATPLVRVNRIGADAGVTASIFAKCEYFNPGGSVKDRIAKRMVEEAERDGRLRKGSTMIEPTSGNTGIGLALCGAIKGYRTVITLPEKMSQEKVDVLKALGAEIIRTPTAAASNAPDSHIGVAKRLNGEIAQSVILDQYCNPFNPKAHYDTTAEEILEACDGRVDMFVAGVGTGGTLTGTAKRIKEACPKCIVVGIDPVGSVIARPESLNAGGVQPYQIEGIGYDFLPPVLEMDLVDHWEKVDDKTAFNMARTIIRKEGLLCGGSSGAAMAGALQAAKHYGFGPDKRVVVILPDHIRNYMTKFLCDDWMLTHNYTSDETRMQQRRSSSQFGGATVRDLSLPAAVTVAATTSCRDALALMEARGFDQLPVVASKDSCELVGVLTLGNLHSHIISGRTLLEDPVSRAMYNLSAAQRLCGFTLDTPLADMPKFFENNACALIAEESGEHPHVRHVVTKIDLLAFLNRGVSH